MKLGKGKLFFTKPDGEEIELGKVDYFDLVEELNKLNHKNMFHGDCIDALRYFFMTQTEPEPIVHPKPQVEYMGLIMPPKVKERLLQMLRIGRAAYKGKRVNKRVLRLFKKWGVKYPSEYKKWGEIEFECPVWEPAMDNSLCH